MLFVAGLYAQVNVQPVLKKQYDVNINHSSDKAIDTIWTYLDRATGLTVYTSPDGGYVAGNAYYYYAATSTTYLVNTAIASHYDAVTDASITGFIAVAAAKNIIAPADALTGVVYAVGADSVPTSTLGSVAKTFDDVDTTGGFTAFMLTSAVSAATPFMCSIEWGATVNDTVGFATSDPAANNGAGEQRARLKLAPAFGGTWSSVDAGYGGFDADVMIFPIVDITTGADFMESKGLVIYPVYPNPASNNCTISYSIDNAQEVMVKVFGLDGKIIYNENSFQSAGAHSLKVELSDVATGTYYYSIKTDKAFITSTISVVK